ncbi:MAG: hypothetical protein O3A74_06065 [archaeon]|nr:hypothetical protein [archaeon]
MERKSFTGKELRGNMVLEIPSHDSSVACIRENLQDVPKLPGCYLIWRNEELIYVGVSGKVWTQNNPNTSHLNQRLSDHFRGTKSDVFPIKVFERIVLNQITRDEIQAVTNGTIEIRHLARDYIRTNLTFTFATTTDYKLAEKTETLIRKGSLGQKPLLNPLD